MRSRGGERVGGMLVHRRPASRQKYQNLGSPAFLHCVPRRLQVRLCLVVNKVDRLILELCLTPLEAYERLKAIIAHVNMIVSAFHSEKFMSGAGGHRCGFLVGVAMVRVTV